VLEVNDLYAGYGASDVIKGVSFTAEKGESLCVLGPNGCGKSTLLKAVARIIPYRGSVKWEGRETLSFSRKELAKKIAILEQSARIYFSYSVWETVSLGRYAWAEGFLKNLSAEDKTIIEESLKKLDLLDLKDRMIDELSGGQLQRVFLAKTLAQTPELILLDEPTNHLDLKNQIELLDFLKSWLKESGKTLIGVFHDLNLARYCGGAALLMHDGKIAARGGIEETLNSETLYTVYGVDIQGFMLQSLEKWRPSRPSA
jgi:iron complex transport system ATP-binding protein